TEEADARLRPVLDAELDNVRPDAVATIGHVRVVLDVVLGPVFVDDGQVVIAEQALIRPQHQLLVLLGLARVFRRGDDRYRGDGKAGEERGGSESGGV